MISVTGLTKKFGRQVAVDCLTFEVGKGEVLGFLGPNGAGKTTTMRMLTGFLPPSRGRVTVDGCDMFDRPIEAKRRIGYLPENPPVYPDMTVRTFLEFVAEIKDIARANRSSAVDRAIERAKLGEVVDKRISKLSKGYRQRVGLAQAIVHEPPVLILDEPTSSLDPKQRVEVRDLIAQLRGSHTVVVSTHILSEVSAIADRVFILNRGRVMAVDTPANLGHRLQAREVVVAQVAPREETDLEKWAGEVRQVLGRIDGAAMVEAERLPDGTVRIRLSSEPGRDLRSEVADATVARGWRLLALGTDSLSLEEIFLKLTS